MAGSFAGAAVSVAFGFGAGVVAADGFCAGATTAGFGTDCGFACAGAEVVPGLGCGVCACAPAAAGKKTMAAISGSRIDRFAFIEPRT